uniref:Uncharacterized protein n=1 Tax=Kalanchoe fedtschenkoi TaxID=63787 RepID=A0A7N0T9J0_KALFE
MGDRNDDTSDKGLFSSLAGYAAGAATGHHHPPPPGAYPPQGYPPQYYPSAPYPPAGYPPPHQGGYPSPGYPPPPGYPHVETHTRPQPVAEETGSEAITFMIRYARGARELIHSEYERHYQGEGCQLKMSVVGEDMAKDENTYFLTESFTSLKACSKRIFQMT